MKISESIAFICYLAIMLGIGVYFFIKSKDAGEKDYFLGGRQMGPWVTAMSAQASDMSGWLLMGLPGTILALGFGQVWISIGLAIGTYLNWLFEAARLRKFSVVAGDSITVPQYLCNRFKSKNPTLRIVSAIIFLVCFTLYVASGFKAGGTLFSQVFGLDFNLAMLIFGFIIIVYTFTGGFKAVCWTDFVQGVLMLVAILVVPITLVATKDLSTTQVVKEVPNYFNILPSGKFDWESISQILSGLAWGLGYFGMPHIIVRFMAIKSTKMIKTSRRIASIWVVITLFAACVIGLLGRIILPELATNGESEQVFIKFVRMLFPGFISGILLSAILAASMSTADSQLLVASSSFTSDLYKPMFRKNASDKELLWVGRGIVVAVSAIAFLIAYNPNSANIMGMVGNAWAGFGSAFGPVILLSLYWKRLNYTGAVCGIVGGAATMVLWMNFLKSATGIYELLPGFIVGMLCAVVGSLLSKKPSQEVYDLYEQASNMSVDD